MFTALRQDLGFAFRIFARDRWSSAAAVVVLALGIGSNTLGFTIINAALIRGLPFEDSHQIVTLSWQNRAGRRSNMSHAELLDWRGASRSFAGLAAYTEASVNVSGDGVLPEGRRRPLSLPTRSACCGNMCCSAGTSARRTSLPARNESSSSASPCG
jgi:hypothetical protein